MWTIDRLTLRLPTDLEARAGAIAPLVARELESMRDIPSRDVARLRVPRLTIDPAMSDIQIAARIAGAIRDGVKNVG